MEAILKRIELKEYQTRDGRKFKKVEFECDVEDSNHLIKTLKGSYSEEFARKYFEFCGVKTKDIIGKQVDCVVSKKAYENGNGEKRIYQFIRFLNLLDSDGKPIRMPREDSNIELDF